MKKIFLVIMLQSLFFLSGCIYRKIPELKPEITTHARIYQTGYATWYGPGFHGRTTASGEIYDMYSYTAAHRTLPLNTIIRVRNTQTGQWIVLRVNDRGPVKRSLVLDLSKIAAIELDITQKGSGKVQIEVLSKSSNPMRKIFEVYANLGNSLD